LEPGIPPQELRHFIVESLQDVAPTIAGRFGGTGPLTFKYGREAVTEVDRAVEDRLVESILGRYPDHGVLGEEAGSRGREDADWIWHIDPIDGTLNYSVGIPVFSSSVAVAYRGRLVAAAVLDPLRDECFSAEQGGGAFLGEKPLRVGGRTHFEEAVVSTQFGRRSLFVDNPELLQEMMRGPLKVRRLGSIALEMAWVAAGRLDLMLAGKSTPPNFYDIAAGILLIEEAGGLVTDAAGRPMSEGGCEIIACNRELHSEMVERLRPWIGG